MGEIGSRKCVKKALTPDTDIFLIRASAEVVKLVDAVDSKSSELLLMPVRVRPSAPYLIFWRDYK